MLSIQQTGEKINLKADNVQVYQMREHANIKVQLSMLGP
jgi:hypothetical protein